MSNIGLFTGATALILAVTAQAQTPGTTGPAPTTNTANLPWMDASLSADQRAQMVLAAMTLDEKIQLVHGYGIATPASNGGAGYVPGIPRLGLPDLNMADSSVGLTRNAARSRYSTLMPATIGTAASWDGQLAYDYGALIGREMRAQGYNVSLAGGVNIMREPRNGRSFEYLSEDPVLSGELFAQWVHGLQDQKVIGGIKHYAVNDQETGRNIGNVLLDDRSLRESDLLAFEIGIKKGQPGMVMCSYNKVNGDWACENDYLLNQVLKQTWGFKGWVLSDWGGTHSTQKAALAGLDQEQPGNTYFGEALKQAVQNGSVPAARLDDMVLRIVRSEFAAGIVDKRTAPQVVDVFGGLELAEQAAVASSVLLKNNGVLPLNAARLKRIVIIGSHADVGVLTGGGSGQVDPPGGNAVPDNNATVNLGQAGIFARAPVWWPSSPLKAIRNRASDTKVSYDAGSDPAAAASAARAADIAIVFVNQPAREGADHPSLSLPDNQDALVAAVAAANPNTIVVLETGGPVTMPWLKNVAAAMEIWYPGARGAEATSALLFGDANFSAKLPVTFPGSESHLPVQMIAGSNLTPIPAPATATLISPPPGTAAPLRPRMTLPPFDIPYPEKALVGYKWFDARNIEPLFPFGHGLSYTTYAYSNLQVRNQSVTFTVRNTGKRDGAEIAQIYARIPGDDQPPKRLVGWNKILLRAGESRSVTVELDKLYLSVFDAAKQAWTVPSGSFDIFVGGSSRNTPLSGKLSMTSR